jgi:hypothetical protein
MNNNGLSFTFAICCVWPIIVHFGIVYIGKIMAGQDWINIRWSEIRFPWSKNR